MEVYNKKVREASYIEVYYEKLREASYMEDRSITKRQERPAIWRTGL